jgi:5-(carboxyamino)imidazole ribonucleotide synthase
MTINETSQPPALEATAQSVSPHLVKPGGVIGMLGGGQLGRMFAIAAATMGYRVLVLTDASHSPAASVSEHSLFGDLNDRAILDQLAQRCDVVTLEFENIPCVAADYLAQRVGVFPSAAVLRVAQDRGVEKQTLVDAGLPVTPFHLVGGLADAERAIERLGLPIVLKTTRDGYDGKGQWKIDSSETLARLAAISESDGGIAFDRPLIAEAWVNYDKELSVIIARNRAGGIGADTDGSDSIAVYPVFENRHRNHILDLTTCPAEIDDETAKAATEMAIRAAEAIGLVGLICIEYFLDADGRLLINEIAPRPHNSGHLTIEACHTSQFEQQLRAVCGLPLGDTSLVFPAAAMINLMGEMWDGGEPDWVALLRIPSSHLHLYDKGDARKGRKMGHLTLVGDSGDLPARIARAREILAREIVAPEI